MKRFGAVAGTKSLHLEEEMGEKRWNGLLFICLSQIYLGFA